MKEIYKGYTIEVEPDGELMDDSEGNLIPGSEAWQYQIFEGTEPDANMEEIVDMCAGYESEMCALDDAHMTVEILIMSKEGRPA